LFSHLTSASLPKNKPEMLTHALPIAALAAGAAAFYPGHPVLYPGSPVRAIAPRQTDSGSGGLGGDLGGDLGGLGGDLGECATGLLGVVGDAPAPPADILSWFADYALTATSALAVQPTDAACPAYISELPSSLASEWVDYQSEVLSWYSGKSDDINKALSACPTDAVSNLPSVGPCSVTPTALASGGKSGGSGSNSKGGNGSGSDSGSGSGGGSGAVGPNVFIAATGAALAALIGAVVLL